MEFWHYAFLAGTATFAIPVIIHLSFRRRKRRLVFSSLRFIRQSVLRQSRRLRLREILLLLLRCAACILLALAFARPFRPGGALGGASGQPAEDLVLILDDSPSLLAQEGGAIRWSGILEKARKEVAGHMSGGRVGLVLAGEPARAEIELSSNFGAVLAALRSGKTPAKRGNLAQALNTAIEMLAASTLPARRIILYSDLQANQIDRGAWAEAAQQAAAATRGIAVKIETPPGLKAGRLANLAVTEVRAKSDVWIEGQPIQFAVRISNFGDNERPSVPVKLIVDDPLASRKDGEKIAASRTVALGPRSSAEFELAALFPRPGEVSGRVAIEAADAFPEDDQRLFALRLRDTLRVLVVEEQLHDKDAFLDEGYYVRMALDPKTRAGAQPAPGDGGADLRANYIQVQTALAAQITPDLCRQADIVILAGVTALAPSQLAALEDAVAGGRNLILFTGRSDGRPLETFYNGPFWKNGRGLLPARPGPLYQGSAREGRYHQLGEFNAKHPLFKIFSGANESYLRLPRYLKHYQPNPADLKAGAEGSATSRPAGEVLAGFGDGSPLALERPYGKGTVLMFTFAPRPEFGDLPKRKAFLPLLHQAVRYLASMVAPACHNLLVGEQFDFAQAGAAPDAPLTLEQPGKEKISLTGKDHPLANAPGIYTLSFQKGSIRETSLWAVNTDPLESDLNSEDVASLQMIFASNPMDKAAAGTAAAEWDDERKAQAPDWRYFVVAAVVCLLLELLVREL